jgi:hypothetical protein
VILCVLALPFAIAEPAKILALYLMATGHVKIGLMVLAGAYFVSLVIVERLFRGGRTKLLTTPWFKTTWQWLMAQRRRLLKWARSTRIWASFVKSKGRIRAQFVYLTRFKNRFSAPAGFSEVNAAVSHTLPSSVAGDADCVALDHSKRRSFS